MTINVSLQHCDSYERDSVSITLRAVLAPLGGITRFVAPGQRILLKPNLLTYGPYVATDPSLVEAVACLVLDAGAQPIVGDSCAMGSVKRVAEKIGLSDRLKRLGLEPVRDLSVSRPGKRLDGLVPHPQIAALNDIDAVINMPKVKVHRQCYLTLAVKNLYGCVPGRRKALWHFKLGDAPYVFEKMLVANCRAINPVLTIMDGIVAMERMGPMGGDPYPLGLIAAGMDPIALDRVFVEILNADPHRHRVLEAARILGYEESIDLTQIHVYGPSIEKCKVTDFCHCSEADMMPIRFSLPHIIRGLWRQFQARHQQKVYA